MQTEDRVPKGPRHAAPKKPLLDRLPLSGSRIALAMPSALLLGVGLSPQLAQAQPGVQNPFRDGPCVTSPDRDPEDDQDAEDAKDAKDDKAEKDADKAEKGDGEERSGSGREESGDAGAGKSAPADKVPGPDESEADEPEDEPDAKPSRHPLDPLGIGEKLRDLFNPDRGKDDEADQEDEESEADKGKDSGGGDSAAEKAEKRAEEKAAEAREKLEAAKEKAAKAAEAAEKERAEEKAEEAAEEDAGRDASGKKPFPCPEFDKEAFEGAEYEGTPALVPDDPFQLNTTRLGLGGLKYHGIVKVRTQGGKEKRALKFTAEQIDIKDLHQVVVGPGGKAQHIRSRAGSTSTFRDGTVTMYTEELKGKLFGLIPITFSPESPPPLDIPAAVFTDAEVTQAGQFGGTLTVPGLRLSLE